VFNQDKLQNIGAPGPEVRKGQLSDAEYAAARERAFSDEQKFDYDQAVKDAFDEAYLRTAEVDNLGEATTKINDELEYLNEIEIQGEIDPSISAEIKGLKTEIQNTKAENIALKMAEICVGRTP
jgi:hypothetical protein